MERRRIVGQGPYSRCIGEATQPNRAQVWSQVCGLQQGRSRIPAHNRVEFLDALFAATKSGVILVPLNTGLTPREIERIASDSGLRAILYEGEFAEARGRRIKG